MFFYIHGSCYCYVLIIPFTLMIVPWAALRPAFARNRNTPMQKRCHFFLGGWFRTLRIQAIRMVYVTARLSFTAILAHYVSILPFLCSPFTRLQIVQISRDFEEEITSILVTLSFWSLCNPVMQFIKTMPPSPLWLLNPPFLSGLFVWYWIDTEMLNGSSYNFEASGSWLTF